MTVLVVAVLLAAAAGWAWHSLGQELDAPGPNAAAVRLQVPPGSGVSAVLLRLQRLGTVRHARWLEAYLRLQQAAPRLQAGLYEIEPHATVRHILQQMAEGRVLLVSLTVVEGWTFAQMRHALDSDPEVAHQLRGLSDGALMSAIGHPGVAPEGRFFPDTYRFAPGTSDRTVLEMAYRRMQDELQQAWGRRAPDLPLADPEQALTLASIVEKETALPQERPKVAAVFVNRLRRGMRLQADPTVIYGLGGRYDGTIHTRDLTSDTPYNTYTRAGLPPTPIALPGAASLQAALHPAPIDALYFVATGDGSHHFSATLAEQDVALRSYLHHLRSAQSHGGRP